jgi:hypothetical protein
MSGKASFKTYRVPRKDVPTSGGTFSVRGISLADLTAVFLAERHQLEAVYERVMNGSVSSDPEVAVLQVLQSAPDVVARFIASANDEPDEWATVRDMPHADQLVLAIGVLEVTFESGGGVKNVVETATKAVRAMSFNPGSRSISQDGSSGSGSV